MKSEFSFKELYDVSITAPYDISIGNRLIKSGETIALFDKIIVSNFNEVMSAARTHGGYNDGTLIIWQSSKELEFAFSQGIFNKEQFALLNNANLLEFDSAPLYIKRRENVILDNDGNATVQYHPEQTNLFVYDENGRIDFEVAPEIDGTKILLDLAPNEKVIIDYIFDYNINRNKSMQVAQIGHRLLEGFLCLEAKTKIQEDNSGLPKTVLIKIPKFKLMSNFSIRLGSQSQPVVGMMEGTALPVGERGEERFLEMIFLEDDIDTDM